MSGIPSWARKGVKVVCVDAASAVTPGKQVPITVGALYVIERVGLYNSSLNPIVDGLPAVWLRGYPNTGDRLGAFLLRRFRPAVEPKTEAEDVALFKRHLSAPRSSATTRERAEASDV